MDSFAIKVIRPVLILLSRLTLFRYRPRVIGVTGSVGKTSAKRAAFSVLSRIRSVRMAEGNLNTEIGMSLTILGNWKLDEWKLASRDQPAGTAKFRKLAFWLKVIFVGAYQVIVKSDDYPDVLILEYGADRPGDILRLMRIARPDVGIVTAVGDIPVHVEFYAGPDDVAREKARLIERLTPSGFAVLNHDEELVDEMRDHTRARVMSYGFDPGADVRVTRFDNRMSGGIPTGISFKLEYEGNAVPVRMDGVLGRSTAYAAAAAACVGLIFDMNLITISEALAGYVPAPSRMELLPGMKQAFVIDDAYNASPLSMLAALDVLAGLPARRKIAVLGDMLEIGKYTIEAHENIGRHVAETADILFAVGLRAKFIADSAREAGMKEKDIHSFDTASEAIELLVRLMSKGDLVLVKGSHAMGLDAVVRAITAVPLEA